MDGRFSNPDHPELLLHFQPRYAKALTRLWRQNIPYPTGSSGFVKKQRTNQLALTSASLPVTLPTEQFFCISPSNYTGTFESCGMFSPRFSRSLTLLNFSLSCFGSKITGERMRRRFRTFLSVDRLEFEHSADGGYKTLPHRASQRVSRSISRDEQRSCLEPMEVLCKQ